RFRGPAAGLGNVLPKVFVSKFVNFEQNSAILDPNNHLFTMARQGKRLPSALEAVTVAFGIIFALLLVAGQIITRLVVRLIFPGGIQSVAFPIGIIGFLPAYADMWLWLRLSVKRPFLSLGF